MTHNITKVTNAYFRIGNFCCCVFWVGKALVNQLHRFDLCRCVVSILIVFLLIGVQQPLFSQQSNDSSKLSRWDALMNWNFMALPYAGYEPETDWQFGVIAVYFFNTHKESSHINDLNLNATYTLNNQIYAQLNSRIYYDDKSDGYMDANISYRHYPTTFYGIGNSINQLLDNSYLYTGEHVDISARSLHHISAHWLIGPYARFLYSNIKEDEFTHSFAERYNISGFGKQSWLGAGASIMYDSRSNSYYPNNGLFFNICATYYQTLIQNGSNALLFAADFRHFIPIYKGFIFAYSIRSEAIVGENLPFELMPTIGGQDIVRGIVKNMFKDDFMWSASVEFRIPIWRFLKATAFCSVGDVYNYKNWNWATPKVGYGLGLRACIHKAKTNIRFDVARNNYNNDWNFYFTVKEAF